MYNNKVKTLLFSIAVLMMYSNNAMPEENTILTYYNMLIKKNPNVVKYEIKNKNGAWVASSRYNKNSTTKLTVDLKNGFIQIIEPMAQGDETVQIALFSTRDKQAFICINSYGHCGDPYGSICQNSIGFFAFDDNNWMDVTKSTLPAVDYKLFFNEKFYASKIKDNRALYDMLRHVYELPRIGTSITVRLNTTGIEGFLNDGIDLDVDTALLKQLLANIKRRDIQFAWNMQKGLFEPARK